MSDEHICHQEVLLREMSGDLKTLVSEFRAMNGALRNTKSDLEKHGEESTLYRRRIDVVWTVVHTLKWIVIFTVGYGAGRPIIEALIGK